MSAVPVYSLTHGAVTKKDRAPIVSNVFKKALSLITGEDAAVAGLRMPKVRPFKKMTVRELIQLESEIGSTLFGAVPEGHRREFFNLDATTWIWYEEFTNPDGTKQSLTTRYEVQEKGILKAQDGTRYDYISGDELTNFTLAVQMYYEQVARGVYNRDPATGQKLD